MQITSNLHSNVSRSTRINSSSVHTYIFVCFTLRVFLQGFVTQNATWCQNRGCICISSTRRNIWSNPHSCNNNSVDRIISKEEEREDPRRDSSIYLRVQWCFHIPTRTTVLLHAIQQLQVILHTELILLQESSKKYYNYKAHPVQAPSSNCSPCHQAFYMAE